MLYSLSVHSQDMATKAIRRLFIRETPHDRFWNQNVHNGVVIVGARLEEEIYEDFTKEGRFKYHSSILKVDADPLQGIPFALGDATRNGVWFRTPLSQTSCSEIQARCRCFRSKICLS